MVIAGSGAGGGSWYWPGMASYDRSHILHAAALAVLVAACGDDAGSETSTAATGTSATMPPAASNTMQRVLVVP